MSNSDLEKLTEVSTEEHMPACTPGRDTELYGGQAVIEGVMMKGKNRAVVACRAPNGEIISKVIYDDPEAKAAGIRRIPFLRGFFILIDSMTMGFKALSFSSDVAMTEEKEKAKQKELEKQKADADAGSVEKDETDG